MAQWTLMPVRKDTIEVVMNRVRYVAQADDNSFTLKSFKGARLVESHFARHIGHDYLLKGKNGRGGSIELKMRLTHKRTTTSGVINGKRFHIDCKPSLQFALLLEELKKHKRMPMPLTHAFAEKLSSDKAFRKEVYAAIAPYRMMQQPDWVDRACAIACTLCHWVEEPISCVICSFCTEPPILTA